MNELEKHLKERNNATRAWIAEDPENRWAGFIVEDVDHWVKNDVYTVQDFQLYLGRATLSDYFKEVHGWRPRHLDINNMSMEEIKAELEELDREVEMENQWELKIEKEDKEYIKTLMEKYNIDEETAIRWDNEARGI